MSFEKRLSAGEFVVLAEMDTPKGVDISELISNCRRLKGRVDAVVIPDLAGGVMRMSAIGGGVLLKQQGLEAILQLCPRDRNRLALQGDLLTAYVLGLPNVIVVKGEAMALSDHVDARPVDDLDELGLLRAAKKLQAGTDLAGLELQGPPSFCLGAAIAPWVDDRDLDREVALAGQKIEAGAGFLIYPPVFDLARFTKAMDKIKVLGVPIIASVYLLKSVGMARYMAVNLPGLHVSEALIRRLRQAQDRALECLRLAAETIQAVKAMAQGAQLISLGWESRLPAVLDLAGL